MATQYLHRWQQLIDKSMQEAGMGMVMAQNEN